MQENKKAAQVTPERNLEKRAPAEVSHDLVLALRSLSSAFSEIHVLTVELLDVQGLLENHPKQ